MGWPCIEFTKTVGWRPRDRSDDELVSYAALVDWAARAGLLDDAAASRLARNAKREPAEAARVLEQARALRGAIYRILVGVGEGRPPTAEDLDTLSAHASAALAARRLESAPEGGYAWAWPRDATSLDRVLWPIAESAASLLTSPLVHRVRRCADDECGWLFVDESRNRSRRWCSMEGCGTRAKVRRYRQRQRG
ncbi:MAG TPA: ABATE domain-containing protein [Longimicrobiales bacterium]